VEEQRAVGRVGDSAGQHGLRGGKGGVSGNLPLSARFRTT
jgi:hypothetical protein